MRYIAFIIIFALLAINLGCGKKNYFVDPAVNAKENDYVYKVNKKMISLPTYFNLQADSKNVNLEFEKIGAKPVDLKLNYSIEGWVANKGNILSMNNRPVGIVIDFITGGIYEMPQSDVDKYINKLTREDLTEVEATESNLPSEKALKLLVIDAQGDYNRTELQHMIPLNTPHTSNKQSDTKTADNAPNPITPESYKDVIILGKALITAAANGQKDRVVKLLESGTNINEVDITSGDNALFKSIKFGDKDIALTLIDKGIDLKHLNKLNQSALHAASEVGFYEVSKKLLEKGVPINAKDKFGNTPVIYSAASPNPYLTDYLISSGANIEDKNAKGETPILIAALAGNTKTVDTLLTKGANIKAKDNDGNDIMMKSVVGGNDFTADKLMASGVGVDTPNNNGVSPLHVAVRSGNLKLAEKLLAKGADVNKQDPQGNTPLIIATLSGNTPLVQKILEFKPDISIKNNEDKNAYAIASEKNLSRIQRLLGESAAKVDEVSSLLFDKVAKNDADGAILTIERGAKVDTIDITTGNTPLFTAVANNYLFMAKKLIEKSANVNHKNDKGNTPLIVAVTSSDVDMIELLIKSKTNVNARNNNGDTALIWAVKLKKVDMVRSLLRAGANPNIKNNDSVSAFLIAYNEGTKEILALLQAAGGHR